MAKTPEFPIRKLVAERKPIYLIEVTASAKDFPYTADLVANFKTLHPEYQDCKCDADIHDGWWIIKFYRECAIDFRDYYHK